MAAWREIWQRWEALRLAVDRDPGLAGRERGVVTGFMWEIEPILHRLEDLDREIVEKGVGSPDPLLADVFKGLFNGLFAVADNPPGRGLGRIVRQCLNEIWSHSLLALISFLERRAKAVGAESWSIGAPVGFPSGVSGTVTISFKI